MARTRRRNARAASANPAIAAFRIVREGRSINALAKETFRRFNAGARFTIARLLALRDDAEAVLTDPLALIARAPIVCAFAFGDAALDRAFG